MSRKCLIVVFALASALAANAEIFFWKGGAASFARFLDPANWDVGSDGGGNAESLVPGDDDEIFGARSAKWDFDGGPKTVGIWDSEKNVSGGSDWSRYNIHLTNGTFTVNRRVSHSDDIYVYADTSLMFPGQDQPTSRRRARGPLNGFMLRRWAGLS